MMARGRCLILECLSFGFGAGVAVSSCELDGPSARVS